MSAADATNAYTEDIRSEWPTMQHIVTSWASFSDSIIYDVLIGNSFRAKEKSTSAVQKRARNSESACARIWCFDIDVIASNSVIIKSERLNFKTKSIDTRSRNESLPRRIFKWHLSINTCKRLIRKIPISASICIEPLWSYAESVASTEEMAEPEKWCEAAEPLKDLATWSAVY